MTILSATAPAQATPHGLDLKLNAGFTLKVEVLETWLTRIAIVPDGGFGVDRTWMIAPGGRHALGRTRAARHRRVRAAAGGT